MSSYPCVYDVPLTRSVRFSPDPVLMVESDLLAPVQRFTDWLFDVDKHPVQAIGMVVGALVMIGSLVWSFVRAVR